MLTRRKVLQQTGLLLGGAGLFSLLGEQKAHALTLAQGVVILANARSMIGVPYVLGAPNWPLNTDCSKLTQAAYASARILIPRTALAQYRACTYCANVPGALVFFQTDPAQPGIVTHVGINVGNGSMVDANSAAGMVIEENYTRSAYWARRFIACATL